MPAITEANVLDAIKPHRENGQYKASVPSTEILAYKYSDSLPSSNDVIGHIVDNLQSETRRLFSLKTPNTPLPPSTNSFNNCNGRWAEFAFAAAAWNKLSEINQQRQSDVIYVYVKFPDYNGEDARKWTNILCDRYKNEIKTFDRDNSDQDVNAAGHNRFTLYASNPDAVILKYSSAEFARLHISHSPAQELHNLSLETQEKINNVFVAVSGTVTPSQNIVAFLSMKNSLRPDRRYQFVREGDNVKAHLMYLKNRRCDTIQSFANKFYAIAFQELTQADKTITDIASTACVASGLVEPIWSVDKLIYCQRIIDCQQLVQTVISDNQ